MELRRLPTVQLPATRRSERVAVFTHSGQRLLIAPSPAMRLRAPEVEFISVNPEIFTQARSRIPRSAETPQPLPEEESTHLTDPHSTLATSTTTPVAALLRY